jgi:hydroxymethylpyrimidine pyrophosphatase-like HAD family hydrolase
MKLIVLDCDGIISKGEGFSFDLKLFARLADLNRRARRGEPVPAVTLNTGRPSPYVEAVLQAIEGWQPALYEIGAGLYSPQTYEFRANPVLTEAHRRHLHEFLAMVDQAVVAHGRAYWQPGKSVCHSLFAQRPHSIAEIRTDVEEIATTFSNEIVVETAGQALNIHPAGIDKGVGLTWLAQVTDIAPAEMAGAGDSSSDIAFLRLVGSSAAPANATVAVKEAVDFLSTHTDTAGLHDILDHWSIP